MKARYFSPALVVCLVTGASLFAAGGVVGGQGSPEAKTTVSDSEEKPGLSHSEFPIPGPLRSFLRMAGISQQVSPEEVLPSLSWSVETLGFQGSTKPSEFLILLRRYVAQARELAELAGGDRTIRVSNCEEAKPL